MRNNEERTGTQDAADSAAAVQATTPKEAFKSPLEFVTPTDFVELPSKGKGYPEGHPLRDKDVIEIKYMTAKEEDILTSQALLKKNIALERFMESVIIDKSIKPEHMLVGDRNAILIAARASGYGPEYETKVLCPACAERITQVFDLATPTIWSGDSDLENIKETPNGTYIVTVPVSKFKVEVRLLTGKDEMAITHEQAVNKKNKMPESNMTTQYKKMLVSVEGHTDNRVLEHFLEHAPAKDMRTLRNAYKLLAPDIRILKDFECPSCGHEQELEVPFGADFFWPDR